jgi:hypothetical protein
VDVVGGLLLGAWVGGKEKGLVSKAYSSSSFFGVGCRDVMLWRGRGGRMVRGKR